MTTHGHPSKWLPAHALGDLDEIRNLQVRQHLTHCERCSARVSRLQAILDLADGLARVQAEPSLQMASRKAIAQAAENQSGRRHTPFRPLVPRWEHFTAGTLAKVAVAALILIGAWVTLRVRLNRPDPGVNSTYVVSQNQDRPALEGGGGRQDLVPDSQQTQLQQALALYEQGRVAEFSALFEAGAVPTQLAVIDYLAALDEPSALALLADLAVRIDLALAVRQAAAHALEAAESLPAGSAVPNEPVVPGPGPVGAPRDIDNTAETLLGLMIIDAETGESVPEVECQIRQITKEESFRETLLTDARGRCTFNHQGRDYYRLSIRLFKPGYALKYLAWQGESLPLQQEVTLDKGVAIGGVVQTEEGQPIAGVTVSVVFRPPMPMARPQNYAYSLEGPPTTDEEGRWRYEHFPSDLQQVRIALSHPGYISVEPSGTLANLGQLVTEDFPSWMNSGIRVTGTVTNQAGEPIESASVLSVFSGGRSFRRIETLTDAKGVYSFEKWESGQTVLTVKAAGYAQDCLQVVVERASPDVHFMLKPEHTLDLTVVDPNGNPIAGALVEGRYWRNEFRGLLLKSIRVRQETDEQGLALLRTLPKDIIGYRISKEGYAGLWRFDMQGTTGAYKVTLRPEGRVSGRVYDRETEEPVEAFTCTAIDQGPRILGGEKDVPFSTPAPPPSVKVGEGQYELSFSYQTEGITLRVQADGYEPYESPTFHSDGSTAVHDIYLTPADTLAVTVYEPNGSPAVKTRVCMISRRALVRNGRVEPSRSHRAFETDHLGQFHLGPQGQAFKLLALSDRGFAEVKDTVLLANPVVSLQPWGRVEGFVYSGLEPVANASVSLSASAAARRREREEISVDWLYLATTDQQGYFKLDRVRPGSMRIRRRINTGQVTFQTIEALKAEVVGGQTVTLQIGGGGRKVTGRFVLPDALDPGILNHGTFETLLVATEGGPQQADALAVPPERVPNVVRVIDQQGLVIDDILPGRYVLRATFHDPLLYDFLNRSAYYRSSIAEIEFPFTVPDPRSEEEYEQVVDLGDVPVAPKAQE